MRWFNSNNRPIWCADRKYLIDWDRKAPSKGAQTVKNFFKKNCFNYIWYEEYRIPGTLLRIDFLCGTKRWAVEYSPSSHHGTFNKFFHKTRAGFLGSIKRDHKKEEILTKNNFKLIEIYEEDLPNLSRKWFKDTYDLIL